ncbi:PAS domain-containing sensor histidine kinase [Bdellovibrio bacteriovorus]|uniref:Sensory/regulatory protein RpfC n=1 Tax=Bdellovibrio bacteriovorus TaxID=959 RepID=A0A150WUU7_BDEBC|nr:PAS domain S-box protein [Bdellovibrio bacteriovorus]KYG70287.1 PAS domain-containing sensor histidine kinase [Bdellovibrio bacteriovorus]
MEFEDSVFFEISSDMVAVVGMDWVPVKLNSVWTKELGWSNEEIIQLSFKNLIHPDDYKHTLEQIGVPYDGQVTRDVRNRYRCKNGSYKYLCWNYRIDLKNRLIYAVVKDITQQKVYDEIYKQANKVAKLGSWSVDVVEEKVHFSQELCDLFEINPKDISEVEDAMSLLPPEARALIEEKYQNLRERGEEYDIETVLATSKGRIFPARVMGAALKENNVVITAFGIVQDISKVKETENILRYQQELLNGLLDSSPSIIYVKDLEGKYILASRQFEVLMGKSKDELLGKTDFELFAERDALRHVRNDHQIIRNKKAVQTEDAILLPDGSEKQYISDKFPLLDAQGNVIAMAGVSTDITELHRYQTELLKAKEEAVQGTKAKSEFLANMSHEIRTPMNSIMGMAEVLLESPLDADQRSYVTILSRASESLLGIINDILDFSKIESGQMILEKAPFPLRETVTKSMELLMIKAQEKKLEMRVDIDRDVPDTVVGDAKRLQQVLLNLVGNGLKFTDQGSVLLSISLRQAAHPELEFTIQDTGIGISEDKLATLFTRFYQGDSSITRRFGGTGLGLSISKELVEKMGGRISVESRPGQGSRFVFTIPLNPVTQ